MKLPESILTTIGSLIVVLIGAAVTFLTNRYWDARRKIAKIAEDNEAERVSMLARLAELERQSAITSQAVLPISAAFQELLIRELTHFQTPRMNELLNRLGPPSSLTKQEELQLLDALQRRTQVAKSDSERDAAAMLPLVMKRAQADTETDPAQTPQKLQVVAVPENPETKKE